MHLAVPFVSYAEILHTHIKYTFVVPFDYSVQEPNVKKLPCKKIQELIPILIYSMP